MKDRWKLYLIELTTVFLGIIKVSDIIIALGLFELYLNALILILEKGEF